MAETSKFSKLHQQLKEETQTTRGGFRVGTIGKEAAALRSGEKSKSQGRSHESLTRPARRREGPRAAQSTQRKVPKKVKGQRTTIPILWPGGVKARGYLCGERTDEKGQATPPNTNCGILNGVAAEGNQPWLGNPTEETSWRQKRVHQNEKALKKLKRRTC